MLTTRHPRALGSTIQEPVKNSNLHRLKSWRVPLTILGALLSGTICAGQAMATPNGVWLSKPQIQFHYSTDTLDEVMADIQRQRYRVVFLDFRSVPEAQQQETAEAARRQGLKPIVWVQSPQYRSLTVPELIDEARHGDGIQVDDHFFANYSQTDFRNLRYQYKQSIFCSIQPFQSGLVPASGCNQLDVQCYVSKTFSGCEKLADRLNAVVSLYDKDTYRHKHNIGGNYFNVFLWPYSNKYFGTRTRRAALNQTVFREPFSFLSLDRSHESQTTELK